MEFRKVALSDKKWISECIQKGNTDGACYCFGNLFAWGDEYKTEIAQKDGFLLMRSTYGNRLSFAYPSGDGDIKSIIEFLMDQSSAAGQPFRMHQVLENNKKELEILFPDMFEFRYNRDSSEYVYSVENMAQLAGKKFHGKKGHVNAFFRKHEDVHCDPITSDNRHICLEIAKSWLSGKDEEDKELIKEFNAIKKSVKYFDELGFDGAILYADGKPVAFTMGERLKNNTFCTHYEKTVPDYRDAFPVINNGFTKLMLLSYDYVNREEDTGSEGLRKAKLSYYPEFLLDKYNVRLKNDPVRKYYSDENDFEMLSSLWCEVFGDEEIYPEYFLENVVKTADIYVYRDNGTPVSVFYLVDCSLVCGNKKYNGKYLYAAATHPEYRKKGIMRRMIDDVCNELENDNADFVCLYPAEASLYDYYEKSGFEKGFSERVYIIEKEKLASYSSARYFNGVVSYEKLRETIPALNYIEFGSEYLNFARFCAKNSGTEITALFDDEDKVLVTGYIKDREFIVQEAISENGNYEHIFNVLSDVDCDRICLKTPLDIKLDGFSSEIRNSGMIKYFNSEISEIKEIYMGQPCM